MRSRPRVQPAPTAGPSSRHTRTQGGSPGSEALRMAVLRLAPAILAIGRNAGGDVFFIARPPPCCALRRPVAAGMNRETTHSQTPALSRGACECAVSRFMSATRQCAAGTARSAPTPSWCSCGAKALFVVFVDALPRARLPRKPHRTQGERSHAGRGCAMRSSLLSRPLPPCVLRDWLPSLLLTTA